MTDPCGGNTRGGDGCRCDPPFGGTMSDTDPWAVIAAVRALHSAVHDFSEDATRAIGPVYAAMCRSCGWTMPCPTKKLLPPEPTT